MRADAPNENIPTGWQWLIMESELMGGKKIKILFKKTAPLVVQTIHKWYQDQCLERGAALSYYALFSFFPICLVILGVIGFFLGPKTNVYGRLLQLASQTLPPESYGLVESTLRNLNQSSWGAGLVGFILLTCTASKIFEALDRHVDEIWYIKNVNKSAQATVIQFIRNKILAFLMVLGAVTLFLLSLLMSLMVNIALSLLDHFQTAIAAWMPSLTHWWAMDTLHLIGSTQTALSYLMLTGVVFGLFKVLPSTRLLWCDLWPGTVFTTLGLMGLQNLVSKGIIGLGTHFKAYGVIGNVMVLMVWIFLIFQIFFLGCEFTYVYTHLYGSRRLEKPVKDAEVYRG
jgi:membrane protein